MVNQEQDTIIVSHKGAILRYMEELAGHNLPLVISTIKQGRPRNFNTSVVKLDHDHKILVLHQLQPPDWRKCLHKKEVVQVKCNLSNGIINFSSAIAPLEEDGEALYFRLNMPKQISKSQLRSFYRVSLMWHQARITMQPAGAEEISGTCVDISLGGGLGSFFLPPSVLEGMKAGSEIEQCTLTIPGILELSVPCKLCRIKPGAEKRSLVGFEFNGLTNEQVQQVMRAIIRLERHQIQNQLPRAAS